MSLETEIQVDAAMTLQKYGAFIRRLAQTELVQTSIGSHYCPRCEAVVFPDDGDSFVHLHGCIVVEARKLLGLPVNEGGNLVVDAFESQESYRYAGRDGYVTEWEDE